MTSEEPAPGRRDVGEAATERAARIQALQVRIRSGRYQVPALEVADAILAAHRMVWTKGP